jgi:hypothetical protein
LILVALMGLTVMIDPYDWVHLRAIWGDQRAVRQEVAMAAVDRGSGEVWKWKLMLTTDAENDAFRTLDEQRFLKNIRGE